MMKRLLSVLIITSVLAGMTTMTALAESRKKINTMVVEVESHIVPGSRIGEEDITVTVRGEKYYYDTYEVVNEGFEWEQDHIPEVILYFSASDDYYFSMSKASAVKLTGATYVSAAKVNDKTELQLKVKLPSVAESVGELEGVDIYDSGYAMWNAVTGAGSYEIRVYRNGSLVGNAITTTTDTVYNLKDKITKAGDYSCRVRPINKINQEKKGEWKESAVVKITGEQFQKIRDGQVSMPIRGEWKSDGTGQWYAHSDGTYTKNNWEDIDGKWYFFNENGYMVTGWIDWNGSRYYCDNSGKMLTNTITPDGTLLDESGRPKTGN